MTTCWSNWQHAGTFLPSLGYFCSQPERRLAHLTWLFNLWPRKQQPPFPPLPSVRPLTSAHPRPAGRRLAGSTGRGIPRAGRRGAGAVAVEWGGAGRGGAPAGGRLGPVAAGGGGSGAAWRGGRGAPSRASARRQPGAGRRHAGTRPHTPAEEGRGAAEGAGGSWGRVGRGAGRSRPPSARLPWWWSGRGGSVLLYEMTNSFFPLAPKLAFLSPRYCVRLLRRKSGAGGWSEVPHPPGRGRHRRSPPPLSCRDGQDCRSLRPRWLRGGRVGCRSGSRPRTGGRGAEGTWGTYLKADPSGSGVVGRRRRGSPAAQHGAPG